jgi:hypothetical protein
MMCLTVNGMSRLSKYGTASPPFSSSLHAAEGAAPSDPKKLGQTVLVLQGGGALGADQA